MKKASHLLSALLAAVLLVSAIPAAYYRLSRDDDNEGESNSIATQRMMLRRYAEQNGLRVVDEYIDDGYSGTTFAEVR